MKTLIKAVRPYTALTRGMGLVYASADSLYKAVAQLDWEINGKGDTPWDIAGLRIRFAVRATLAAAIRGLPYANVAVICDEATNPPEMIRSGRVRVRIVVRYGSVSEDEMTDVILSKASETGEECNQLGVELVATNRGVEPLVESLNDAHYAIRQRISQFLSTRCTSYSVESAFHGPPIVVFVKGSQLAKEDVEAIEHMMEDYYSSLSPPNVTNGQ